MSESVFQTLERSNAVLHSQHEINHWLGLAYWSNQNDHVTYNTDQVHTLSLYTQGGEGCRRLDCAKGQGAPGTLCMIPQGQHSEWEIGDTFSFAHLYFNDQAIKRFAARELDIEPRTVFIPDLTFHRDPVLADLVVSLFTSPESLLNDQPLQIEQSVHGIFHLLLSRPNYCHRKGQVLKGGLAPRQSQRLKDYLHCHFDRTVTLAELGQLVGLSEFHLQRAFKLSHGISPSEYLQEVRVQRAKLALAGNESLASIALTCGFSNQSYFSRVFKQWVGVSPSRYRKELLI